MPYLPYPVSGTVYSIDGSTAVASGSVSVTNASTGDRQNATTNSSGQYIIDLANFKSGYSNGDVIIITAGDGTYSMTWRFTVTGAGSTSQNMTLLNDIDKSLGREEFDTYAMRYSNVNATVATTITPLISPYDSGLFRDSSITIDNASAQTLTTKIWVSNKKTPGTVGGADWAQLGSDVSNATGTRTAKEWTGKYKWTAVTGTAGSATTATVSIHLLAST